MFDIALSQDDYSIRNALLWGNCSNHAQKSSSGSLGNRIVHVIITAVEAIPIIGQIVSLFEMFLASCFCQDKNTNSLERRGSFNPGPGVVSINSNDVASKTEMTNEKSEHDLSEKDYRDLAKEHLSKGEVEEAFVLAEKINSSGDLFLEITMAFLEKKEIPNAKNAFLMFENSTHGDSESLIAEEIIDLYKRAVELEQNEFESYIFDKHPKVVDFIIRKMRDECREVENLSGLEKVMETVKKISRVRNIMDNEIFMSCVVEKAKNLGEIGFLVELDNDPAIPLDLLKLPIIDFFQNPRHLATVAAKTNKEAIKKYAFDYLRTFFELDDAEEFVEIAKENSEYPEVYENFMLEAGTRFFDRKDEEEVLKILSVLKEKYRKTHDHLLDIIISSDQDNYKIMERYLPKFVSEELRNEWKSRIARHYYIAEKKDLDRALELANEMPPGSDFQKDVLSEIEIELNSLSKPPEGLFKRPLVPRYL